MSDLVRVLRLIEYIGPRETTWTKGQKLDAFLWAMTEHAYASDNDDVKRLMEPECVKRLKKAMVYHAGAYYKKRIGTKEDKDGSRDTGNFGYDPR